jgi:MHS family alpha-ketoglutarate permease-like MFS transporter
MTQQTSSAAAATAAPPDHEVRRRIFAIVSASSGNLVEWFDFYVYAFTAIYFSSQFFPKADQTVQLLQAALVFAAGFLMRPLGGWVFGRVADRYGRRISMLISILMMCGGSLVIAVMPTYASIGAWAPAFLLLARMFQGLAVGGEYGTSATYMSEVAIRGRRGFYSSFQYVTLIGGQLLASLVIVILQATLTSDELKAWGWRIPFVIGALTAVVSIYLRASLTETTSAETRSKKEAGTLTELFSKHKRPFFTVIAFTAGGSLIFYTFTTYMQKYLINTAGMDKKTASYISTTTLFIYMCLQPVFGILSDKIGRKKSMIWFGLLATLTTVPVLTALKTVTDPYEAGFLIVVSLAIVSLYTSISGLIKAEMFPTEVRALGVGLSYGIANAIFGGSAEAVALQLKSMGSESYFFWYVTILTCISFLVSLWMPDSSKTGHLVNEP